MLDSVSRSQRRVVRATFTAELLGGVDTIDKGFLITQAFHGANTGNISAANSRDMRENGGYSVPMVLYIDALSVYAAVTAVFIKTPADQSVLCHLHYLRELLDHNVLRALVWSDTRDMIADGLTKGAVDRTALHEAMSGIINMRQVCKLWHIKSAANIGSSRNYSFLVRR